MLNITLKRNAQHKFYLHLPRAKYSVAWKKEMK